MVFAFGYFWQMDGCMKKTSLLQFKMPLEQPFLGSEGFRVKFYEQVLGVVGPFVSYVCKFATKL